MHTLETIEQLFTNDVLDRARLLMPQGQKKLRKLLGRNTGLLGTSAKIDKEDKTKVSSRVLYLAPHKLSGVNLCPSARTCVKACLNTAGHGRFTSTQEARISKTKQLLADPVAFAALLMLEIQAHAKRCSKAGITGAIRLNGTSDINWSMLWHYIREQGLETYEYTKRADMADSALTHVTYSFQGLDHETAEYLQSMVSFTGRNIAVVFDTPKGAPLPKTWAGLPVLDGDVSDNRFNDPAGAGIVGLRVKGEGRKLKRSRFIVSTSQGGLV